MDDISETRTYSHWNHRVMYVIGKDGERYYTIHEVHYNTDNSPVSWTGSIDPFSEGEVEGLRWTLTMMLESLDKEPLHFYNKVEGDSDFGGTYWGVKERV